MKLLLLGISSASYLAFQAGEVVTAVTPANDTLHTILQNAQTPLIVLIVVYGFNLIYKAWREDTRTNQETSNKTLQLYMQIAQAATDERRAALDKIDNITKEISQLCDKVTDNGNNVKDFRSEMRDFRNETANFVQSGRFDRRASDNKGQ